MTYQLVVTPRAKDDRNCAYDWYSANYSKEFADRWYEGIAAAIDTLRREPLRCHRALENDRFPFELYELLFGKRMNKHRILFRVHERLVVVLHIRHSALRELREGDL